MIITPKIWWCLWQGWMRLQQLENGWGVHHPTSRMSISSSSSSWRKIRTSISRKRKSYWKSAGGKSTGFSRAFQIFKRICHASHPKLLVIFIFFIIIIIFYHGALPSLSLQSIYFHSVPASWFYWHTGAIVIIFQIIGLIIKPVSTWHYRWQNLLRTWVKFHTRLEQDYDSGDPG